MKFETGYIVGLTSLHSRNGQCRCRLSERTRTATGATFLPRREQFHSEYREVKPRVDSAATAMLTVVFHIR